MNNFRELTDKDFASQRLANHLIDGTLVLFLGAGVSRGFGLPGWIEFANQFRNKVELDPINKDSSSEDIQTSLDQAISKIEKLIKKGDLNGSVEEVKLDFIQEILYSEMLNPNSVYDNKLLIAITSLLVGRKRGHVRRVVSFNYDSILEWFLSIFGFQVRPIVDLPALEGSEDVRIYHPHGFVPHPSMKNFKRSKLSIVGKKDANNRIGQASDYWREKLREIMQSGFCLFIGMSINSLKDRAIEPLLEACGKECKDSRPLGIWISKEELNSDEVDQYLNDYVVPVQITDSVDIANFILSISQNALTKSSR